MVQTKNEVDLKLLSGAEIDKLIAVATEEKAERTLQRLEPLRKEYADIVARIDAEVRPFGLDSHRFLTMTQQGLRKAIIATLDGGDRSQRPANTRVPPRYRNPENPEQTWTGRGMVPHWVRDFKARGGDLTTIEVPRSK